MVSVKTRDAVKENYSLDVISAVKDMAEEHLEQSNHLAKLEREMLSLAEKSKSASVEELIEIADRVGEIESELGNISNSPQYATLTPIRVLQPVGGEA